MDPYNTISLTPVIITVVYNNQEETSKTVSSKQDIPKSEWMYMMKSADFMMPQ